MDGDTLLRLHPLALKRPDLIQRHRETVTRILDALMAIRCRVLRHFASCVAVLIGVAALRFLLAQYPAHPEVYGAGSFVVALGGAVVLSKIWTLLLRIGIHLLIRIGTAWFKARLASVLTVNRTLERIYRFLGLQNGKKTALPTQFQALLEAAIDLDEEQKNRRWQGRYHRAELGARHLR